MEHKEPMQQMYDSARNSAEKMWRDAALNVTQGGVFDLLAQVSPRGAGDRQAAANVRALPDDKIHDIVCVAMFGAVCAHERMYGAMLQEPASDPK